MEYKDQHYVPQYYLKNFSDSGDKLQTFNLVIYQLKVKGIKNLFYEPYFWGQDSSKERSIEIEGSDWLKGREKSYNYLLKKITDKRSLAFLSVMEKLDLCEFLLFQYYRTIEGRNSVNEFVDNYSRNEIEPLAKERLKELNRIKGLGYSDDYIDSCKIKVTNFYETALRYAHAAQILITDLDMALLINNTSKNFVTSDEPIIFYNYIKADNIKMNKIQAKGLLIFCPLNTKMALVLYDSCLYNIPIDSDLVVQIDNASDIDSINKLQVAYGGSTIAFSESTDAIYVQQLDDELIKLNGKGYRNDKNFIKNQVYRLDLSFISMDMPYYKSIIDILNYITKYGQKPEILQCLNRDANLIEICQILMAK